MMGKSIKIVERTLGRKIRGETITDFDCGSDDAPTPKPKTRNNTGKSKMGDVSPYLYEKEQATS